GRKRGGGARVKRRRKGRPRPGKARAKPGKAGAREKARGTGPEEFVVREEVIEVEEVPEPMGRPGTGEVGGRKDGEFGDFENDLDEDTEDFSPKASDPDVTMDDHDWGDEDEEDDPEHEE